MGVEVGTICNFFIICVMKKAYKNQIFHTLRNNELGFDNFSFATDTDGDIEITYKPYDGIFKYVFAQEPESFDIFSPYGVAYKPGMKMEQRYQYTMTFEYMLNDFELWLENEIIPYIEDESQIDLWEEYKKNEAVIDLSRIDYHDQENFTIEEKKQIIVGIKELKLLMLRDFSNSDIESKIINERLDYLIEATNRIENKTDWKGIFINTFITVCIALTLDSQRGNELYQLFLNVLHIIKFLP
jgi:hypothetical protein